MEGRPYETNGHDPARLRISDADRHRVAEVLRHAAGEGRIDLSELDERLEAAYQARTYGDLVPITADLPRSGTSNGVPVAPVPVQPPAPAVPAAMYTSSVAVLGDCKRRGVWRVPEEHTAFSLMGSVTLDLREAVFEAREVTITAVAIMGGIDVAVGPGATVVVDGVGIMGDFSQGRDKVAPEITAASPVVRVRGLSLMGGVSVRRRPLPGEPRRRLGRA
jgi:hypothetical protein